MFVLNDRGYSCPVELTLGAIGGKWKVLILWRLVDGTRRYSELRRSLPGITHKVLAQQLRELEADGLIHREVYPVIPPRVEYSLAPAGVRCADRVRDLARGDTINDAVTRRWVHMIPADAPVEAVVSLEPGHVWSSATYAQHGSPHDYDAHVPLIFHGPAFRPGRYDQFARVVDIAPTLARVLGIQPAEPLDGVVLEEALR